MYTYEIEILTIDQDLLAYCMKYFTIIKYETELFNKKIK